jgi:hypothetical protein
MDQPLAHPLPVATAPEVAADPLKVKKPRKPRTKTPPRVFEPLDKVTRSHVVTAEAAHYLNLAPQTLRAHACFETGLIRPVRIPGVLALQWPVSEIRRVLGLEVQS